MPKVTYIEHNGTEHSIDLKVGRSVMQGALDHGIPGIDADCGGECACATCHVYVDPDFLAACGTPGEMEVSMLGFAATAKPNSRLSCQIRMTPALAGLIVRLPKAQH